MHMTGGQPARGTEFLTFRWCNSSQGVMQNIFIENGLVSFVTSDHKNYSFNNTAKIIHRYLPPEVSGLAVYYIWLVIPFLEQLQILTPVTGLGQPGSFLWPASIHLQRGNPSSKPKLGVSSKAKANPQRTPNSEGEEPWESKQLGLVIAEEFKRCLKMTVTIILWRHCAIAISRRHLPEGNKFKRDYSVNEGNSAMDLQAAHSSKMAGAIYEIGRAHV